MAHFKLWTIVIEPEQGYGKPYFYIFQNGDNAMNKFQGLVKKYNLTVTGYFKNEAIAGDDKDHKHINRITIEPDYTFD